MSVTRSCSEVCSLRMRLAPPASFISNLESYWYLLLNARERLRIATSPCLSHRPSKSLRIASSAQSIHRYACTVNSLCFTVQLSCTQGNNQPAPHQPDNPVCSSHPTRTVASPKVDTSKTNLGQSEYSVSAKALQRSAHSHKRSARSYMSSTTVSDVYSGELKIVPREHESDLSRTLSLFDYGDFSGPF